MAGLGLTTARSWSGSGSSKSGSFCTVYLYGEELRLTRSFQDEHPGGSLMLQVLGGSDITRAFEETGHSASALRWANTMAVRPDNIFCETNLKKMESGVTITPSTTASSISGEDSRTSATPSPPTSISNAASSEDLDDESDVSGVLVMPTSIAEESNEIRKPTDVSSVTTDIFGDGLPILLSAISIASAAAAWKLRSSSASF